MSKELEEKSPLYKAIVKHLLPFLAGIALMLLGMRLGDGLPKEPMTLLMIPVVLAVSVISVGGVLLCMYACGILERD